MKYNRNKCLQLLKYSQYLNDQGKSLIDENEKKFMQLLDYAVLQSDHIYWENRKQYLKVMKEFVNNRFSGIEFETKFLKMFRADRESDLKAEYYKTSIIENFFKEEQISISLAYGDKQQNQVSESVNDKIKYYTICELLSKDSRQL
jgi:hypothetical protein